MHMNTQGVWSITTQPLEPNLYGYSFIVDGVGTVDPLNPKTKSGLLSVQSMLHVPGPASLPWEINDVPHGALHQHFYKSQIAGDQREFYVYTPPQYNPTSRTTYPVLYLLHGFSDDAGGWTAVGRAHVILDNLIARGEAKPMLVVMPLGYGVPEILTRPRPLDPLMKQQNIEKFRDTLIQEVMPQVEHYYRVSKDRKLRAIAGLSMGGAESLFTGLNSLDRFSWIGSFSAGMLSDALAAMFPKLDASSNDQLRLLWIGCGKDDGLHKDNLKLINWLNTKGVHYTWVETSGGHTWMVWRLYLSEFVPLLFK